MPRVKRSILFICQSNDARSQLAEALINTSFKDRYEAFSAGTEPGKLDPYAVKVMKEIKIDISKVKTKSVEQFYGKDFDFVVTLCDEAEEECPSFIIGKDYIHESIPDPARLGGSDEKITEGYRKIRDDIRSFLKATFGGK